MFIRRLVLAAAFAATLLHPPSVAAQAAAAPVAEPGLRVGDTVPAFHATGFDGAIKSVDYPKGTTTLVVFFLSGCPTCHKMLPLWNEAYARRPKNMTMVGVVLDQPPPGFFEAAQIAFPVYRSPGKEVTDAFKLKRVPYTVRVAPGGRVEGADLGLLDGIRMGELFRP
jgi:thiol-disulfide isomerase/thioredoxin